MRALHLLAAVLVGAWVVVALPAGAAGLFTGDWAGTWSDASIGQNGRVALRIDDAGGVQGTVANDTQNLVGPISGEAGADGHVRLTYTYDGGRTRYVADGSLQREGDQISGSLKFLLPNGQTLGLGLFKLTRVD